ncbi:nuclear transport factor 2 family protein [Mycolicibacterium sp.]|uniref:nuclear transport factor 2 family protein n=1 Tax=Mycolicibacterium sp. TaxID=2320850 RepID=UPI00355DC2AA
MSTSNWNELPAAIAAYLTAHPARDVAAALEAFAPDAVVTDEGRTHRGRQEIQTWLGSGASEYTYTTEFRGATRIDATRTDVVQHLEGDFPGGVADLHFRFTLAGGLISRLVIEP